MSTPRAFKAVTRMPDTDSFAFDDIIEQPLYVWDVAFRVQGLGFRVYRQCIFNTTMSAVQGITLWHFRGESICIYKSRNN